jgi:hypothetical protein
MTVTTTTAAQIQTVPTVHRAVWLALAFAVGGALGAGITAMASDEGTASPTPVASAPAAPAASASSNGLPLTADAAEHWLISNELVSSSPLSADAAERQALADQGATQELCTSSATSADAAERCIASR